MLITYYTYLEVKEDASIDEIRHSFRRLAFKYHPDRNSSPAAHDYFIKINKAHEVLTDPLRRQKYNSDLWLFRNRQQKIHPNTAPRHQYASTSASNAKSTDRPHYTGRHSNDRARNEDINNKADTSQEQHKNVNKKKDGFIDKSVLIFLLGCFGFIACIGLIGGIFLAPDTSERPRATIETDGQSETHLSNRPSLEEQIRKDDQPIIEAIREESAKNKAAQVINKPSLNETMAKLDRALQTETVQAVANTPPQQSPYKNNRLSTGEKPYRTFYGDGVFDSESMSCITFNNGDNDVIIILIDVIYETIIRHYYIRANDTYTMQKIPDGTYRFKAYSGHDWNPTKFMGESLPIGGFDTDESFYTSRSKKDDFVMAHEYYTDHISYPSYEITLYGVYNGNMQTKNIKKTDFFNY